MASGSWLRWMIIGLHHPAISSNVVIVVRTGSVCSKYYLPNIVFKGWELVGALHISQRPISLFVVLCKTLFCKHFIITGAFFIFVVFPSCNVTEDCTPRLTNDKVFSFFLGIHDNAYSLMSYIFPGDIRHTHKFHLVEL